MHHVRLCLFLSLFLITGCHSSGEFKTITSDPDRYRATLRYEFHSNQQDQSWTGVEIDLRDKNQKDPLQYTLNFEANTQAQELFDEALAGHVVKASLEVFTQEDPNVYVQMRVTAYPGPDDSKDGVTLHLTGNMRMARVGRDEKETPIVVLYFDHEVEVVQHPEK